MKKILKTASNRLIPKRESISFVMRMTISIILFFTFVQSVWAQIPLSRTGNALRTGDILYYCGVIGSIDLGSNLQPYKFEGKEVILHSGTTITNSNVEINTNN